MRPGRDVQNGRRWPIPRAKTAVPRVPENYVFRDQLRDRLAAFGAEFPVTLVCAPAGHGKTLLLADWVEKSGTADKVWVSLDASDNDPHRFWTAVCSAARASPVVPPGSPLHRLNPPAAVDAVDAPGFLAEVIDAFAVLPVPLHLVLDDLDEVLGNETWHGIATLVRHQPRNVRLVLSARADPPLPLARLRLAGGLGELRAAELRFTPADAAELLRRANVPLDDGQVRRLVDATEGWPAGLRLAARSLRDVPDREAFLAEFAGNDRAIADFLVSEVLARLPAETADLLQLVSVCDEVTPALAAALTGRSDAGAVLAGFERDSSLVLGVGPDRQWYRMHPLLRSYLRADLTRRRPGVVTELHETAAAWFAGQERPDKAFAHLSLTGEHGPMVELLGRHAPSVLLTGDDDRTVRRALTTVGAAAVARSPRLALISALAHAAAGEHGAAEADLAGSWAAWPEAPDADLVRLRHLVLTTRALISGRPPPGGPPDWHDLVAAHEGTDLEAWMRLGLGWALLCAGEAGGARRELEAAGRLARGRGQDYVTMHGLSVLGVLSALDGDFAAVEADCSAAIDIAYRHDWTTSPWLSADHVMIGFARLLRLDPSAALDAARHAYAALAADTDAGLLRYLIDVLAGAVYLDTGGPAEGLPLLRRARHDVGHPGVPVHALAAGALIEHRATLDLGHETLAQQLLVWARERLGAVAELSLMQAWTYFAHDDPDSAEAAVHAVLDGQRPVLGSTTLLEARLLETALEIRRGRRTKARGALDAALALAEPAALIRPFHHADVSVRQLLLEQVGGFGRTNAFAARVAHAMSTVDATSAGVLTTREHAVLVRLSSPQSLDELATDLSVSVNTVKTHVRAIYAKLGVNNRRAAVVAGRQLGLD
jgi:LuxR family maltose regulon positive regulatory protein